MDNNTYDICLIFPPMTGVEFCPPAGIPSLVAYLKANDFKPYVLDMDYNFKKSFLRQSIPSGIQLMILSLYKSLSERKNNLNSATSSRKNNLGISEQFKIKVGSLLYSIYLYITFFKIFIFHCEKKIQSFEQIFKEVEKKNNYGRIERCLEHLLNPSIKNIKKIGISVMYPQQIFYSLIIAKLAKKINKDIFIILGGTQITMHIQKFINNKTLFDYIDGFIVHEGEIGLCELLKGEKPNLIPNLYYKKGDGYEPSKNVDFAMPVKQYMTPDFEGFNTNSKSCNSLSIRTLRGCFWGRCRFCSYPYVSGKFDMTSAEFVVESIIKLKKKHNLNRFEFIDSSLPANFLKKIAEKIIENNINISWLCRADYENDFRDNKYVSLLKQSGCERLAFGLESVNERIFINMNKLQKDKETILEVTKTLKSQGIISYVYVMFGFPTETKKEMEKTLDFVMMLKNKYQAELSFSVFNLLEHTYIYSNPEMFKIEKILKEENNSFHGYGYKFVCTEGAGRKEVYSLWNRAVLFNMFPFLYDIYKQFSI